ncbi:hypothetical protein VVR12_03215 [Rothia sp. LK2588]|uniref:hypothetical protein n=1 Tax=Rothia sp. LK2588 TaxID=3114369 RepID=UPI0034CE3BE6
MNITPASQTTEDALNELVELQNRVAPDLARIAELEKFLKALDPGKYTTGALDLTVSRSGRFSKKRFAEAFPPETHPQFYKTTVEPDVKTIAPAVKEQFTDYYDNRIKIS